MNKTKSVVYFINTSKRTELKIANILGFQIGEFPIKYLGVQLSIGRFQNNLWEEVINKCHTKAAMWKNKWLTKARRIQMIKSVLSVVPIYYMSCFRLSSKAANDLDGLLKKFSWEGSKDKKKIPLIN